MWKKVVGLAVLALLFAGCGIGREAPQPYTGPEPIGEEKRFYVIVHGDLKIAEDSLRLFTIYDRRSGVEYAGLVNLHIRGPVTLIQLESLSPTLVVKTTKPERKK